jgi:hypothetical protein
MTPAQRDGVLVADSTAESAWLSESQMVCVRRTAAANQTRLCGHEPKMRTVTIAAWFAERERALVDVPGDCIVD